MSEPRTNRLSAETSPYLLQHRHNPVDWYPWGPEAFEAARRLDRPIFLSVGYSTCYWCHVMERESFENGSVAEEMNGRFINIKVDREERPDVDQVYMTAVQLLTRQGGWPMSVFLMPDLRPFYGGTYFPPTDHPQRPGFVSLLRGIDEAYRRRRDEVEQSANQILEVLKKVAEPDPPRATVVIDDALLDRLTKRSASDYDSVLGGYGGAPKFPRQTLLELLLVYNRDHPDEKRMGQLRHTLDAMLHGGIRDQLGGGFHRYSTDAEWLVPHFEIMLYDNAMLGWCYVEAYRQTEDRRYAASARGIFDFVLSDMTSPDGAFYTAFDAEVDSEEGKNYLWTRADVEAVLAEALGDAPDAEGRIHEFCQTYGLDDGPNFADPHHGNGMPDQNILFLAHPMLDTGPAVLDERLAQLRQALLAARKQRKQPSLDTKIITSWNGLMIRALAYGGQVLQDRRYVDAGARAADFILAHHGTPSGGLHRTSRDGVAKYAGYLDDYAFMAQAMVALHDAGADESWKHSAEKLTDKMVANFHDPSGGFYFTAGSTDDVPVRQKVGTDSPLPSGNGIAAIVCLALGRVGPAADTLAKFAGTIQSHGDGMSALVQAAAMYVRDHGSLTVAPGQGVRPDKPRLVTLSAVRREDRLVVTARIADGYHINSNDPPDGLIATTLTGDGVVDVEYPEPERIAVGFDDRPLPVYSGTVRFVVRTTDSVRSVTLRYQACDDNSCQAPTTVTLEDVPH